MKIFHAVLLSFALAAAAHAQQKGGEDISGPYEVVPNWPQPIHHDGWSWGSTAAVWAESPDRVFVFQRGELPVLHAQPGVDGVPKRIATSAKPRWEHCLLVFDRAGKLIEAWTQHDDKFVRPHRIVIDPYDPEKHVWLVDDGAHQVFKFSHDGKRLAMVIGEKGKPGNDHYHFNRPTDIAFLPNGDFYVTDGYVNTRVVKYDEMENISSSGAGPGRGRASSISCTAFRSTSTGGASTSRTAPTRASRCSISMAATSRNGATSIRRSTSPSRRIIISSSPTG